jgi:hypothetical protein
MTRVVLFGSLLLSLLLLGCGGGNPNAPAAAHGKVTYNGKTLSMGTVTFHDPGGFGMYPAPIKADGSYSVRDIPAGDGVVVTVDPGVDTSATKKGEERKQYGGDQGAKMPDMGEMMKKMGRLPAGANPSGKTPESTSGKYMKIPERYKDPKGSPLKYPIKKGDQLLNIELTD